MPTYLLSIGSNIDPRRNVPRILSRLLEIAPSLRVSRILETAPVGIRGEDGEPPGRFLNLAVLLEWASDEASLKARLVEIEEALGRDRSSPERKLRSRTADLDILATLGEGDGPVRLEPDPYVRDAVRDLLPGRVAGDAAEARGAPGVAVGFGGEEIGCFPVRLAWTPEGGRVADDGVRPATATGRSGRTA